MQTFSQRDPRWAGMRMGNSNLTIGRYGCTTTGIADLSTYFGDNFTPGQASKLIRYIDGKVDWTSCNFKHFKFWFRERNRENDHIKNALADPNIAVLLNVANGSHWVVAVGVLPNGIFKIADPWYGDIATMTRYQNSIVGAAYFKRR